MTKLLVGISSYKDLDLLKEMLPAVEVLRKRMKATVVLTNNANDKAMKTFMSKHYPKMEVMEHPEGNIGYGKSYNYILKTHPGFDYLLVLTSDVLLNVPVVERLVKRMDQDKDVTLTSGKLHWWDIANHRKTKQIDSLGIAAEKRHHFYDRGHGELDRGQYDRKLNKIFGISGAVLLVRIKKIPLLHGEAWKLYDENMWMYKEDIDLSYRLRWLGEGIKIYPEVWGWHGRAVANKHGRGFGSLMKADQEKRDYGRAHSYRNHLLMLKTNFSMAFGLNVLLRTVAYELLKGFYMGLTHPRVFFKGMTTLLFKKSRRSNRVVSAKKMLTYFK